MSLVVIVGGVESVVDWRFRRWASGSPWRLNRVGTEIGDAVLAETDVAAESVVGTGFRGGVLLGGAASIQAILVPVVAVFRAEISMEGMPGRVPIPRIPRSLSPTPSVSVEGPTWHPSEPRKRRLGSAGCLLKGSYRLRRLQYWWQNPQHMILTGYQTR